MKKIFLIFLSFVFLLNITFAYNPTIKDNQLLNGVYGKLDTIHTTNPEKIQKLGKQIESIKSKYLSNERLYYILNQLEEYIAFQNEKALGKDTRVIDGDTIEVTIEGVKEKIRMIGIDTPELGDEDGEYGEEATKYLKTLIEGKNVYIEIDESQGERDKYQRLLAFVFLNKENINKRMISEGFAFEYTYDDPYKYQEEFRSEEKKASENKLGIWENNEEDEIQEDNSCNELISGELYCDSNTEDVYKPASNSSYYDPSDTSYLDMGFTCNKRKYCSYMDSCDEVKYFFYQCNAGTFDRDNDGIPCENICGETMIK